MLINKMLVNPNMRLNYILLEKLSPSFHIQPNEPFIAINTANQYYGMVSSPRPHQDYHYDHGLKPTASSKLASVTKCY